MMVVLGAWQQSSLIVSNRDTMTPHASSEKNCNGCASCGHPCDPHAIRRAFPEQWRGFLHAHFRSVAEVALFFSVEDRTARNWWEGSHSPQGWAVAMAVQAIPSAANWLRAA